MITEGLVTKTVDITITREKIRNYCDAIGEKNAIFHNIEAAQAAGYADLVVPATYPTLFWQGMDIPWLNQQSPIVQSNQTFDYKEPLLANVTYTCYIMLTKVRHSRDKQFLQHELYVNHDDKTIATSNTTLVLRREKKWRNN